VGWISQEAGSSEPSNKPASAMTDRKFPQLAKRLSVSQGLSPMQLAVNVGS